MPTCHRHFVPRLLEELSIPGRRWEGSPTPTAMGPGSAGKACAGGSQADRESTLIGGKSRFAHPLQWERNTLRYLGQLRKSWEGPV